MRRGSGWWADHRDAQTLRAAGRSMLVKVPEITVGFWAAKLLTTAFGESASDFLVHAMPPVAAVLLGFVAFVVAIGAAVRGQPVQSRGSYWLAVLMVAVFGTMAADVCTSASASVCGLDGAFAVVLAAVFTLWHRGEDTLSIHSIVTTRRETFYWPAVLATFAMGTAPGDLPATT